MEKSMIPNVSSKALDKGREIPSGLPFEHVDMLDELVCFQNGLCRIMVEFSCS